MWFYYHCWMQMMVNLIKFLDSIIFLCWFLRNYKLKNVFQFFYGFFSILFHFILFLWDDTCYLTWILLKKKYKLMYFNYSIPVTSFIFLDTSFIKNSYFILNWYFFFAFEKYPKKYKYLLYNLICVQTLF